MEPQSTQSGNDHILAYIPSYCTENPIYVFSEMKLCDLVPYSNIPVPVSDLYNYRIGLPILLQPNRQTNPRNI
jgi:hypothetical protein